MSSQPEGFGDKVAFVWKVADKLRGNFRPHEYGQVMLPLLVLRRLDAVLEPTKQAVLLKAAEVGTDGPGADALLKRVADQSFYNTSELTFTTLLNDATNVAGSLQAYIHAFSPGAVEVLEQYGLDARIAKMDKAGILYQVLSDFADLDLHPDRVSNEAMGYIFEELLRKFSEMSNETAGEHYTPREVIRLMVNLLFAEDREALTGPAPVRTIYDPAAGTGGMLTVAEAYLRELNSAATLEMFGQELNPETWAIARSDLMIKGVDPERMVLGNSLVSEKHQDGDKDKIPGDGYPNRTFDYVLANPPYGVDWKAYSAAIKTEALAGDEGRYAVGLPRVSDGSFLFVQHMLSKMKPIVDDPRTTWPDGGSRIGIVLSGSPLFSGGAGSGESEIRRWIIENDWLEGIVALPDSMFYNTGISTYVWILTNRKPSDRRGKVVLVDGRDMGSKMRRALGDKRKELSDGAIKEITRLFGEALELADDPRVRVLTNDEFGYARLTIERPLRRGWRFDEETAERIPDGVADVLASLMGSSWGSEQDARKALTSMGLDVRTITATLRAISVPDPSAEPVQSKKSSGYEPDADARDQENIPLPVGFLALSDDERIRAIRLAAEAHLTTEIHPFVPDAWVDHEKTRIGYEFPFTRQFYVYSPPRSVTEIRAEMQLVEEQLQEWMKGIAE